MKAFSSHKNTPSNTSAPQYTLFPRDRRELRLMIEYIPSIHDHKNNTMSYDTLYRFVYKHM